MTAEIEARQRRLRRRPRPDDGDTTSSSADDERGHLTALPLRAVYEAALAVDAADLCGIPAAQDGTKAPISYKAPWKRWQSQRPVPAQLKRWYVDGNRQGLGLVCGAISNNLEVLDIEGRAFTEGVYDAFIAAAVEEGLDGVIQRIRAGYEERTAGGGMHLLYYCSEISGNLKLARRPSTPEELAAKPKQLFQDFIETRGEGGFVVIAPSQGPTHPNGQPWVLTRGDYSLIATITPDERQALHALVRRFNQAPAKTKTKTATKPAAKTTAKRDRPKPEPVQAGWEGYHAMTGTGPGTPVQKIVAALKRAGCQPQPEGQGYLALCPVHEGDGRDHHPSLAIDEGEDGTALLVCRSAGCTYKEIMTALGLPEKAGFPPGNKDDEDRDDKEDSDEQEVKTTRYINRDNPDDTYDYTDADDNLAFQVCRYDPKSDGEKKSFLQRRPNGRGGWIWNIDGIERFPYRLPEVRATVKDGRTIWVVEGEKDVESLRALGGVATTNPMGAGKWTEIQARYLYGATEVRVVPDWHRTGWKHAAAVYDSLVDHVSQLSVWRVQVDHEGADVTDHLEAGWSLGDLVEIRREDLGTDDDNLFHDWTMAELLAQPDHFAWLAQGMWCHPSYGMIAGELKTMKSYLALFFLIGVAAGVPVFGEFAVPQAREVVTWCAEGGWRLWRRRAQRIAEAMGVDLRDLPIHPRFDAAPITSEPFQKSLARDLARVTGRSW